VFRRETQTDYIREAIKEDLRSGRFDRVHTRFPPEPNAYLHIGHAKAVWIDYGIALDFGGLFNLRFDDTNPLREEQEFVDGIIEDVRWLGADWGDRLCFASDYFEQMYDWAVDLIRKGKAYVCDLSADELSTTRGTLTSPGQDSPYRNRGVAENLDLFARMREGEFPDGARTLRAKIDMASPNMMIASSTPNTTARARSGASIRCTTGRTASRIRSRASRTRCAPWNTKFTARSTTGSWISSESTIRARSSSPASA
jgi:glutamyl/glutaminyl-tRNA synthetase